ncbi:esterase B1-like [Teleopsis dalmanni]|uniref:esterase B1-like n=1 Tax=Teleopsis dalmanni TaxID=139649 RepID=UPI0018CEBAFA|nr:esterase B1-like [Teleopsis dalmanni]
MAIGSGIVFMPVQIGIKGIWVFIAATIISYPAIYWLQSLYLRTLSESEECNDYASVITQYLGKNWGIALGIAYFLMLLHGGGYGSLPGTLPISPTFRFLPFMRDVFLTLPFTLFSILFVQILSPMNIAYRKIESDKRVATYRAIRANRVAYIILAIAVLFFAFSFTFSISHEQAVSAFEQNISALAIAAQVIPGAVVKVMTALLNIFAILTAFLGIYLGFQEAIKVIEPYLTPDCVVPKKPIELMRTAWSNKIPMIIGGVSNEGLLLYTETKTNPKLLNDLGDCRFVVPMELNMDRDSELCKEYGQQLRKTYYGEKDPSLETLHEYLLMVSHEYFWFPIYRTVLSRMEHAPDVPTFLYRFDFDSKHFNHLRILSCGKKVRGTCHGDDLSYLFYNSVARKLKKTSREYKCIEKLVGMWTHFATYGNPNFDPELTELWQPLTHVAVEKRQPKCLNISDDLKVIDVPDMKKLMMWESFFGRNELT